MRINEDTEEAENGQAGADGVSPGAARAPPTITMQGSLTGQTSTQHAPGLKEARFQHSATISDLPADAVDPRTGGPSAVGSKAKRPEQLQSKEVIIDK